MVRDPRYGGEVFRTGSAPVGDTSVRAIRRKLILHVPMAPPDPAPRGVSQGGVGRRRNGGPGPHGSTWAGILSRRMVRTIPSNNWLAFWGKRTCSVDLGKTKRIGSTPNSGAPKTMSHRPRDVHNNGPITAGGTWLAPDVSQDCRDTKPYAFPPLAARRRRFGNGLRHSISRGARRVAAPGVSTPTAALRGTSRDAPLEPQAAEATADKLAIGAPRILLILALIR